MRRWWGETTGGLPRTFWYLWAGTLINRAGGFVVIFLTIYLTTVRHFSPSQAGLIMGLWSAGGAAGSVIGGVAADRLGRKPTLLASQVLTAAVLLVMAFMTSYWVVAVLGLLLGLAANATRPAFSAMMVDIVPERDRLRAFTLNYWAINVGFAVAAVLAGIAAQADYHLIFIVDATGTLATFALLFFTIHETRGTVSRARGTAAEARGTAAEARGLAVKPRADVDQRGMRHVLADRTFMLYASLNTLTAFVFLQHLTTLPIAMSSDGISARTYGSVIALNGVLIVVGQLFIPKLVSGLNRSRMLAAAAVVMGVGFGLTAFADTPVFYAVTVLVWTLGEMINAPANSTLLAELSPAALRGRYQGVFALSWSIAGFAAPIVGGFLQEHTGNSALWLACAGIGVVVAAAQVISGPARERRARALTASLPKELAEVVS
jgi:MFS family permease